MKNNAPTLLRRQSALYAAVAFAASCGAQAQTTPLPTLPGYTQLQQNVANAIDVVCPRLGPAGISANQNGTPAQRLAFNCTAMVVTSAVLQGKPVSPETAARFDLGIGNEQLRDLVQASGPVQHNAQSPVTLTSSGMNLLSARLFDLRSGVRGMSLSVNGVDVPLADSGSPANARGGAASADSPLGGRLSGFVKVAGNWGNVDKTSLQDAYDYDAWSILAGADYRVTDALVAGGALSYEDTRSRFDNSLGHVDAATWSVAGYASYSSGPWYVDGYLSYGHIDYDTARTIVVPSNNPLIPTIVSDATASPSGDQWSISAGTGYNMALANNYTLVPFARLGYINVKNKAFSENESGTGLGLAINERTLESLQTGIGATISTTFNTAHGVFGPFFTAQWVHEFKNDNPSIVAKFVNDPNNFQFFIPTAEPTRDYGVFIVGSTATLPNGFSGFLQFGAAAGLRDASNYSVVAGLRKEF
ncbi:MAG TPA: autotransporter outer membrane beta-barrel domain-containing protein [Casimicrobiaceae bacterium]